ncbi:MAG: BatA and WFA domain-containing protein [Chloroflexi bacterium]|nr:BatA and WFA domain-containing protein [Chloroflexota bacterium]
MISPLALMGLIGLPIIVAFYMLRLRRRDVPVGSTFLWQQLIRDVEANAPWQRLRFSWLLLVQLLIAAIVVLAAARPFLAVDSDLAANVVLIVDTSASMATRTDDEDRMALARERARDVIGRLPVGGRVTVVAASDTASVLVSETDDREAALEAVAGIQATQLPGDLTDAFALSSALAARDEDSTIVVVTDAAGDRLPDVGVGAPVQVELIGSTDGNQAIAALSALRRAGGAQLDLFVAVSNPSAAAATRRLEIYADDALIDARGSTRSARRGSPMRSRRPTRPVRHTGCSSSMSSSRRARRPFRPSTWTRPPTGHSEPSTDAWRTPSSIVRTRTSRCCVSWTCRASTSAARARWTRPKACEPWSRPQQGPRSWPSGTSAAGGWRSSALPSRSRTCRSRSRFRSS